MSRKLPKATAETLEEIRRQATPAEAPGPGSESSDAPPRPALVTVAAPSDADRGRTENAAAALRRARAGEIVERYAAYSAVGGLIPLPILDTLGVMATVAMMIRSLAAFYGEPLKRDRARALAASVLGGIGQAGASTLTTAALAKLVPGANFAAAMISSAAAVAMTRAVGRAFVLHYETGGTALTFDEAAIRTYFSSESLSQPISRQ